VQERAGKIGFKIREFPNRPSLPGDVPLLARCDQSRRCNSFVAVGGIADIGHAAAPDGSVAIDPERHFAPVNYRTAQYLALKRQLSL
jgi:hypothetical protein